MVTIYFTNGMSVIIEDVTDCIVGESEITIYTGLMGEIQMAKFRWEAIAGYEIKVQS